MPRGGFPSSRGRGGSIVAQPRAGNIPGMASPQMFQMPMTASTDFDSCVLQEMVDFAASSLGQTPLNGHNYSSNFASPLAKNAQVCVDL